MIDFRYHLVSLISVFLALAVGVVLGAGPLQNSLGTALNDQVTSLRADRNETKTRLEQTEAAVNDRDDYIAAAAGAYLPGALTGRKTVLVGDIDLVTSQLQTAGATIVGRVSLTTVWADAARETFRSTYSGQFAGYLGGAASNDTNAVLGQGLATALTTSGQNATALSDLLTASDTPLMTIDAAPTGPADSLVVIGPRTTVVPGTAPSPAPTEGTTPAAWNSALGGAASVSPTVVLGAADVSTDLVAQLRTSKTAVTTVDSVGQVAAAVSVPLALVATIGGARGAYGFDDGADAVMPPAPGRG